MWNPNARDPWPARKFIPPEPHAPVSSWWLVALGLFTLGLARIAGVW